MRRLRAALAFAVWLPCAPAAASTDAVLPLVGQELTVVTVQAMTPSRLDRNVYSTLRLSEPVFERPVLLAVERALRNAGRTDQVVAILASETATVGTTRSAARASDADPANALSDADKLTVLRNLLGNELVRLLPGMLAKAPR